MKPKMNVGRAAAKLPRTIRVGPKYELPKLPSINSSIFAAAASRFPILLINLAIFYVHPLFSFFSTFCRRKSISDFIC